MQNTCLAPCFDFPGRLLKLFLVTICHPWTKPHFAVSVAVWPAVPLLRGCSVVAPCRGVMARLPGAGRARAELSESYRGAAVQGQWFCERWIGSFEGICFAFNFSYGLEHFPARIYPTALPCPRVGQWPVMSSDTWLNLAFFLFSQPTLQTSVLSFFCEYRFPHDWTVTCWAVKPFCVLTCWWPWACGRHASRIMFFTVSVRYCWRSKKVLLELLVLLH